MLNWVPENTKIDFIGKRMMAFVLSSILVIGSIGLLLTNGLNFGIDFTGGTLIEVKVSMEASEGAETPDLSALRKDLNGLELGVISLQEFGAPDDLLIRMPEPFNRACSKGVQNHRGNKRG